MERVRALDELRADGVVAGGLPAVAEERQGRIIGDQRLCLGPVVRGVEVDHLVDTSRVLRGKGGQLVAGDGVPDERHFRDAEGVEKPAQVLDARLDVVAGPRLA